MKASVYAVYDESGTVKYIGVSRSVAQSLRLSLARQPEQTYGFRVFHITKPSRVLLEITRDTWIAQLGYQPEVRKDRVFPRFLPPSHAHSLLFSVGTNTSVSLLLIPRRFE